MLVLTLNFCAPKINEDRPEKIKFDLSQLSDEGLIGEGKNLRAIDYEFCIPKNDSLKEIVFSIDSTVKFFPRSSGRIACGKSEILCVGNTNQPEAKETLLNLAELDFIKKIEQTFYE
ncbi:MAG: hypothetical protein GXO87_08130 [Chlorobi bacterium]|nr:hypothetical protein [Chlorobiota bacterium]